MVTRRMDAMLAWAEKTKDGCLWQKKWIEVERFL
jgi:hypothetical protein